MTAERIHSIYEELQGTLSETTEQLPGDSLSLHLAQRARDADALAAGTLSSEDEARILARLSADHLHGY